MSRSIQVGDQVRIILNNQVGIYNLRKIEGSYIYVSSPGSDDLSLIYPNEQSRWVLYGGESIPYDFEFSIKEPELKEPELPKPTEEPREPQTQEDFIEREYERWRFSKSLENYLTKITKTKKERYEALNILERFLVSSANIERELSPTKYTDPIYLDLELSSPLYQKMEAEFKSKRINPKAAQEINEQISKFLSLNGNITEIGEKTFVNKKEDNVLFRYKKFQTFVPLQLYEIFLQKLPDIEESKDNLILMMLIRYASMISRGQQWSLPLSTYKNFQSTYGEIIEGFASPLNSKAIYLPNAQFCSLFYDTDHYFGSLGNLFYLDDSLFENKTLILNPPFIENLINELGTKIESWLSQIKTRIVLNVPEWSDAEFYLKSSSSPYLLQDIKLDKGTYKYEKYEGNKLIEFSPNFESHVFVFES